MKGLKGSGASSFNLDLSSLATNANYKPEETTEEVVETQTVVETTTPEITEEVVSTKQVPTQVEGETQQSVDIESSLTEKETVVQEGSTVEVNDETVMSYLSEKLGREITSFDELTKAEQTEQIQLDEDLQAVHEWQKKTGRPVEDFFKFQKDYSTLSDIDIAREFLQLEYPSFTNEDINMELLQYQESDMDMDNETALKMHKLKKYATKGRETLNELKSELQTPSKRNLSPENTQKIEAFDKIKAQYQEQATQDGLYEASIREASLTTESLSLNLTDDLSIDFKLDKNQRMEIPSLIKEMPHWKNEDGSWNHKNVVSDGIKVKHFDKLIQLAYEQGANSGKDQVIKDAKNVTLSDTGTAPQVNTSKKSVSIEGLESILKGQKPSVRFGRK